MTDITDTLEAMEEVEEAITRALMIDLDNQVHYIKAVTSLYIKCVTVVCSLQKPEPDMSVKEFTEGFTEAVRKDIISSVAMTCKVNGWEFHPDPNKDLRDEILNEH